MFRNIFTLDWFYSIIDYIFFIKLKLINIYNRFFIEDDFILQNAILYTNLSDNYNIKYYFKNNNVKRIDNVLIENICQDLNILLKDEDENEDENKNDARLKINFRYKKNNYILYYPLKKQIFKNMNKNNYFIPYPPYNDEMINNYRKSIVAPNYNVPTKNSILYSLFMIDSKDINIIEIYKENLIHTENNMLIEYFNKIKTPFNDYGLLYHCPIKVKWILHENNIDYDNFRSLYIKFLNMYLDEDIFDLKEHFINIQNIEDFIISNRMKSELTKKNKEIIKELEDLNK